MPFFRHMMNPLPHSLVCHDDHHVYNMVKMVIITCGGHVCVFQAYSACHPMHKEWMTDNRSMTPLSPLRNQTTIRSVTPAQSGQGHDLYLL